MFGLPDHMVADAVAVFVFGLVGVLVVTLGTLAFDWGWRKVDLQTEVKKNNLSAGIVMASVVIGLSVLMAFTVTAITGGH